MKVTPRRGMPDLSPIPAPLAQIADWHRAACRAASLHGLDMAAPGDRAALSALMGWGPAPNPVPEGWRRRMTEADRLRAMQRLARLTTSYGFRGFGRQSVRSAGWRASPPSSG